MKTETPSKPGLKKRVPIARRAVSVTTDTLVETRELEAGRPLPLLVTPSGVEVNLIDWVAGHQGWISERLQENGGILFRGFKSLPVESFQRLIEALSGESLEYTYRSTPRSEVSGRIYTSTEYPADLAIPMHNEMSYSRSWPLKIWFQCVTAAATGGETPIADSRRVYARMPASIREVFAGKGVLYVRNYGGGIDLPWQDVFQTDDRGAVEAYCENAEIELEWLGGDRLRTRQVCQGVARHPTNGELLWFNQAHLFHVSSLRPEVRTSLLAEFGEENLPRNAFYGDGEPIPEDTLETIRRVFDQESIRFPWQEGDILLLDNMLTAHGRMPFTGERKILTGMAEPAGHQEQTNP